jgi:hypothetical protein
LLCCPHLICNRLVHDRLKESERERQHELERSWNRPHLRNPQSTPHSHEKPSHHVYSSRPASSLGYSSSSDHTDHRPHSRPGHDRPGSASPSSSTSSRSHAEEGSDEEREVKHDRERNWNAPHPKWGQHTQHHNTESGADRHHTVGTTSPEPPVPSGQDQQIKHIRPRASSSPSSHSHSRSYSYNHLPHDSPRSQSSRSGQGSSSRSPTYSPSPQDEDREEEHERERNWNAPRPRWEQHSHHRSSNSVSSTIHAHPHTSASGTRVHLSSKYPLPSSPSSNARRPRPNSPLPSINNDLQQPDETRVDYDLNENSLKGSPSARRDHTPSSEFWSSTQHLQPKSNGGGFVSRSDQELGLITDPPKRHRRTTTELSESTGSFPKQNGLPPSFMMLDASNASLFGPQLFSFCLPLVSNLRI